MRTVTRTLIAIAAVATFATPAWSQAQRDVSTPIPAQNVRSNIPPKGAPAPSMEDLRVERVPGQAVALPALPGWRQVVNCLANSPADVIGYRVQCSNASYLDFQISDCCIPNDHWQLKGKSWDVYPNTAVTTSPNPPAGASLLYGLPARIYNYGGTSWAPRGLDAYVECSYLNGVNVFPGLAYVLLSSDGSCTVTPDPAVHRIDRTP